MRTLPVISTEYIECTVEAFDPTTRLPIDTSSDVVEMAFVGVGAEPITADWRPAIWTASQRAGILVGPHGGVALAVGDWDAWVRITDNPEQPADKFDTVRIT
jgi:hypothetical protein